MRYLLVLIFSLLTACGAGLPSVKPYKMDIQQGNVVTSKMLLQLRPGMTKSQVRYIMGTPLVVDSFHRNRWDYFYQMRQAGKVVEQRRVILEFENDLLARVRGDVVPAGTLPADGATESNVNKTIEVAPTKREEKSWTDKLKFWKKDEKPAEPAKTKTVTEPKPEPKAAPAAEPSNDVPAGDTPSVLVVPMAAPAEAPQEMPKVDAPQSTPVEPAKPEPTPVPEPVKAEPIKPTPGPVAEPQKSEPVQAAPAPKPVVPQIPSPAPSKDDKLIFRMDKTLRPEVAEPVAPTPEPAPVVPTPKAPAKKVEPLPEEEGPGYFERILEKIGF